ncbi:MAG TPA: hypothetical protein VN605_12170, partial [Thermoanaerobaculia bacterium]|nr:hypothetical protein [Thermoanaerobaculia bacterium]
MHLALDLLPFPRPRQHEARGERADDHRRADALGEIGEREGEDERGEEQSARDVDAGDEADEIRRELRADDDGQDHESERDYDDPPHAQKRQRFPLGERADEGQ